MITENLVWKEYITSLTFILTCFLFDLVCYQYYLINKTTHSKIKLGRSPLFISAENSDIIK